jgi:predicted RecB family nuclease
LARPSEPALREQRDELDESAELITSRGLKHEANHLAHLKSQGLSVFDVSDGSRDNQERYQRTLTSMRLGFDVVFQATLLDGDLVGHADFLMKVKGPSSLGDWHYEVADTKLARSPQAKFLIQLAFYSRLLTLAQGHAPELMHVVLGDNTQRSFRCADYGHYLDALLQRFKVRLNSFDAALAPCDPEPVAHCDTCHWRSHCDAWRTGVDHLSQVAGIQRTQWKKLQVAGVCTMRALATLPEGQVIARLQGQTLERIQAQARLQDQARVTSKRSLELLPLDEDQRRGFYRLPEPHRADLFFDMEGNPLEPGGLEYLFGLWFQDGESPGGWQFKAFWAHDRAQERLAFEAFMDFVSQWREQHPGSHIYHYAAYEETALKRLASQHATREAELDHLLRTHALVDLYKVVREGLRISEPSYSIKYVEHFYRPPREGDVQNAGASIVFYERWRETGSEQLLIDIANYNRDDVKSTQQLRDWLLKLRPEIAWFPVGGRHAPQNQSEDEAKPSKALQAEVRLMPYRKRLVDALPLDRTTWTAEQHRQELIYQLLDFHRRAQKPEYWALFSRMDLTEEELFDDAECLAGLTQDPANPPYADKRSVVYTYKVPPQESKLKSGDTCTWAETAELLGPLTLSADGLVASVRRNPKKDALPARISIGPSGPIKIDVLAEALFRFADAHLGGIAKYKAQHDLLMRAHPDLKHSRPGQPLVPEGSDILAASLQAVRNMQNTCLYVQGPPGSGKTYTGSRMIATLLKEGKRVGIMSNSHKAIHHLLGKAIDVALEWGVGFSAIKKCTQGKPDTEFTHEGFHVINEANTEAVAGSDAQLIAGTAWLFADANMDGELDYLFVDEAGQVSLANLLAAGTAARNIVLLGDQMQLSQPIQGVHPGRSGDSALDYLLDGRATIPPDRGIFLATSYRMHPEVCQFISDAVYDSKLLPAPDNIKRTLLLSSQAHPALRAAGLVHVPMAHEACSQSSEVEAQAVCEIYESALQQHYTDEQGQAHPMSHENILVVAPYNVQVNLLKKRLPPEARVGTVDKFQGQEAELVIVSMTTSGPEDLPRNIEFLFSKNRLNVAISRAKCQAIVLANPELLGVRCQTPEQMALVNTLCWVADYGALAQ